jgi:hypothetical protein
MARTAWLTCMMECLRCVVLRSTHSFVGGCVAACLVGVCTRTGCHTNQQQCESLSLTPNESKSKSFCPNRADLQTVLPAAILAGGWELVRPVYMQRVRRMGRCVATRYDCEARRWEGGSKSSQGKARRCDAMDGFGNALFSCHVTSACCGHFTAYSASHPREYCDCTALLCLTLAAKSVRLSRWYHPEPPSLYSPCYYTRRPSFFYNTIPNSALWRPHPHHQALSSKSRPPAPHGTRAIHTCTLTRSATQHRTLTLFEAAQHRRLTSSATQRRSLLRARPSYQSTSAQTQSFV